MVALAVPANSADPHYKAVLDRLFPVDNRGQDETQRTFELILSNDVDALKAWVSDPDKKEQRVNGVATKMLLHPLHVCAMTGSLECARTLVDTEICRLDPQDLFGATPLHHAAVRGNHAMIGSLLKDGAKQVLDRCGGTYLTIMRQMQPPKPEEQTFYYKNEDGKIVKGNGHDFKRLTGATLLDKDCQITPQEWLKLWQSEPQVAGTLPPSLQARYEEFSKKPTLTYMEKHPVAGFTLIAGEDIEPGMVIVEYLGDVCVGGGSNIQMNALDEMTEVLKARQYVLGDIDAALSRGMAGMCNDSMPNAECFELYNTKGLPIRYVVTAIDKIKKGTPIVFNYGIGHGIRFGHRVELRKKAFFHYYRSECAKGFPALVNKAIHYNDGAYIAGHRPEAEENLPIQSLIYIFSTPSAMLHLLCEGIIGVEELKSLFSPSNAQVLRAIKMWMNVPNNPVGWARLDHFYQTTFQYFDKLDQLPPKKRKEAIAALGAKIDSSDLSALIQLMGGKPNGFLDLALGKLRAQFAESKE
jgi:hypothetical protein